MTAQPSRRAHDVLIVASSARWVADDFRVGAAGRDVPVQHSWGLDVPWLGDFQYPAWWTPTEHAARLIRVGVPMPLLAPGPDWLAQLPVDLLGRRMWAGPVTDLPEAPAAGWFKPAEAKVPTLPAGWWESRAEFAEAAGNAGLLPDSWVQAADTRLEFTVEHRCFVVDGVVRTSSPYLLADGSTWCEGMEQDPGLRGADAARFAAEVAAGLGDDQPPAYVLDVALTAQGRWVIVEANPAWSSATYGSDLAAALDTVLAACDDRDVSRRWLWRPDPWITARAARKVPLPVRTS